MKSLKHIGNQTHQNASKWNTMTQSNFESEVSKYHSRILCYPIIMLLWEDRS
jgi:hypothetical protein